MKNPNISCYPNIRKMRFFSIIVPYWEWETIVRRCVRTHTGKAKQLTYVHICERLDGSFELRSRPGPRPFAPIPPKHEKILEFIHLYQNNPNIFLENDF